MSSGLISIERPNANARIEGKLTHQVGQTPLMCHLALNAVLGMEDLNPVPDFCLWLGNKLLLTRHTHCQSYVVENRGPCVKNKDLHWIVSGTGSRTVRFRFQVIREIVDDAVK